MKNTQRITPKIPEGMVELLKNLAKSILKEQPSDIYVFAAEYFENLVRQRDGDGLDKGYGKFRKYHLEIPQLNGNDFCPRCHCTLHPVRIESPENNEAGTSPKNTNAVTMVEGHHEGDNDDSNENAHDMSVNGVAIKALPRDAKSSSKNNQKNRLRLETISSVSMDSAIDDDAKSQFTSPKSSEGNVTENQTDSAKLDSNVNAKSKAVINNISEKAVLKGAAVAAAAAAGTAVAAAAVTESDRVKRDDDIGIGVTTPKLQPNEMYIEQISNSKMAADDDVDSSPNETTTTTSVSEANTDRTVIEVDAPLNIEPSEITADNSDKNDSIITSEETVTVVTKPNDDEQLTNTSNKPDSKNLQLNNAKQMDRLCTPESDSGLSEKSFNLAINEGSEAITNEMNTIKNEMKTTTTTTTSSMTTSESTVEKIQVKSNEKDFDTHSKDDSGILDVNENQNESELNIKNELLSTLPTASEAEKQTIVTESTEMMTQATKSIETVKTEMTKEITEVKSATMQKLTTTVEKMDKSEALERTELKESHSEQKQQSTNEEAPQSSPAATEKSITIEQEIDSKDKDIPNTITHSIEKQPEITSETSESVLITSELKDGKQTESMAMESSHTTKSIASNEQSEKMEIVSSHTRTKRGSNENVSVDDAKISTSDTKNGTIVNDNLVEQQPESDPDDDKTQIIDDGLNKNDLTTQDESGKSVTELTQENSNSSNDEPDKSHPPEVVSTTEKQTIETSKSTNETTELTHQQQMEVKSELISTVNDDKIADKQKEHTTMVTEEKSKLEQKTVESESNHSSSEQVTTTVSQKIDTTNESTAQDNETQSHENASEVSDLIGKSSNVAKHTDSILNKTDPPEEQNDSTKATIIKTDHSEKLADQPADINVSNELHETDNDANEEELQQESKENGKDEATLKDQTEKEISSSEKLADEIVTTKEVIQIAKSDSIKSTSKMEEQHEIVQEKLDMKLDEKSDENVDSAEQSKTIGDEKVDDTSNVLKTVSITSVDDMKSQDVEKHQNVMKIEEISTEEKSDEGESIPPTVIKQHTIIQTMDSNDTDESNEQLKQQVSPSIQTDVVESVVKSTALNKTENEKNSTEGNLSDKLNEQDDQSKNSWDQATEQIVSNVQKHDGNQIKATAPLLTDITDDSNSSNQINEVDRKEHVEITDSNQNEKSAASINSETVETILKNDKSSEKKEENKTVVESSTTIVSTPIDIDEKMHTSEEDTGKKDADDDTVNNSKEIVSADLNVSINEINVMNEQGKENTVIETTTTTTTVDDGISQTEKETSSSRKIEDESIEESKDHLKIVEIETKTTVPSNNLSQQMTIDPVASVIETHVAETKESSPIDASTTAVNNNDKEKIDASIDLSRSSISESNKSTAKVLEQHTQNEQHVIESIDPNLTKPENDSFANAAAAAAAADRVKENSAVQNSNNLNGMNNINNDNNSTTEMSAMPKANTVDVMDSENAKPDSSNVMDNAANIGDEKLIKNTNVVSSSSSEKKLIETTENSSTKTLIENEQRNASVIVASTAATAAAAAAAAAATATVDAPENDETKSNNNDDIASELSTSAKDEYEQAVTRSVGDDSEKELLNLSLNNDYEQNQINDSVNSEQQQQITIVEIATEQQPEHQQIDHDSIDSTRLKQMPMQPDSLDIVADSLDVSLEPSVEADSLNIDDTSENKSKSTRSIDVTAGDGEEKLKSAQSEKSPDQSITNEEANELPLVRDVLIEIENKTDDLVQLIEDKATVIMGDIIDVHEKSTDNMNDQMRNELNVLKFDEKPVLPVIEEVSLPISPKPSVTMTISNEMKEANDQKLAVDSDSKISVEKFQEPSKNTDNMVHVIETTENGVVQALDDGSLQTTTDAIESSIDNKKIKEEQTVTDKVSTKITENLAPAAAMATAAAAAGASSIITTMESMTKSITESQTYQNEEKETLSMIETVENARITDDNVDVKSVEHSKPIINDIPSSDFSDTETTTDKAEKMYTESGVDETSRDEYERDEVSEIENFDLSSCGEDSLEAMYYMIRKNEIIMDRHKDTITTSNVCSEEERIVSFPEKATDDLEQAVREVSGNKQVQICSIGSMDSSIDDVVLKKMSSDSDELQLHVVSNSEIKSSSSDGGGGGDAVDSSVNSHSDGSTSEPKNHPFKDQSKSTANETTDDEYNNQSLDSMRKSDSFDEVAAVAAAATVAALSFQTSQSDSQSDDQNHNETDTFNEHQMDDMVPGNIERKILASSISDGDSDAFDVPTATGIGAGAGGRLTKDNFNVSTAFEHMIRTDSITEESDSTIESAATKIQAGARGFLTRHRNKRSDGSASTSVSTEKGSSIGNAAIDKTLDNLIESKRELHEQTSSTAYSESFEESFERTHSRQMLYDQTIDSMDSEKILGITDVKVEHRKEDDGVGVSGDSANDKVPDINIQGISEESATAQRRRILQRGDAMQHNSSADQQSQHLKRDGNDETSMDDTTNVQNDQANIKTDSTANNSSKPIGKKMKRVLGVRQRSMPVQIDTQLIRILPKHLKKRVKSANLEKSSKNNVRRPSFF